MDTSELPLWQAVDGIRERDGRFRREAYLFVVAALGLTAEALPAGRRRHPEHRHLSGQELLRGVIALARREFGALAPTVFSEWGVESAEDVGTIVFELVQCGELSARPEDTLDDFCHGPDLQRALTAGERAAPAPRPGEA